MARMASQGAGPVGVAPAAHGEALDRRLRGPVQHVDIVATATEILSFDGD
jgi:hypothetical protein